MNQAQTAITVYRDDIEPTAKRRQRFVREHLVSYLQSRPRFPRPQFPTALELLAYIQKQYPDGRYDVNSVRPRLSELEAQGLVQHGEKRRCTVSGKVVYTWVPSTPAGEGRLF